MKKFWRAMWCMALIACMMLAQTGTALAATKGIKSVNIKIDLSEEGENSTELEEAFIDIKVSEAAQKQYTVTKYEILEEEEGSKSTTDEFTMVEITLTAASGYKFGVLTSKNIKVSGNLRPIYVGSKRENSNANLVLKVKLEGALDLAANVDYAEWDYSRPGVIKNYAMSNNAMYEVRLVNGDTGKIQSLVIPAGVLEYDMAPYMRIQGEYNFNIREVNVRSGKKGKWFECEETFKVDEAMAEVINQKTAYISVDGNGWQQDAKGWWFKYPNGSYPASQWLRDNNQDFYFNAEGYMVTGWNEIDGAWYYMNERGEKQFGTVTPDGYTLDEQGRRVQ